MNTVYVSDLDGTLLDGGAALPEKWRDRLNALLGGGLAFTVATGRSQRSTRQIMEEVDFSLPLILLNGAILYDWHKEKVLRLATLSQRDIRAALDIFEGHGLAPVVHTMSADGTFHNSYKAINPGVHDKHFGKQVRERDPRYRKVGDYHAACEGEQCFFIATIAMAEDLAQAYDELRAAGVPCDVYDDVYTGGRFLECCSADKGTAALELKRRLGAQELVAIGDNLNDLPMLRAADRAIVVEGAHPEALAIADEIIRPCTKGGVLDFLENESRRA